MRPPQETRLDNVSTVQESLPHLSDRPTRDRVATRRARKGGQAMRRSSLGTQGFALLAFLLVALATAAPAAAQGKPIRIGEINSYSGLATVYTFPYKEGLLMAAKEINDAGGVLGRPIEF